MNMKYRRCWQEGAVHPRRTITDEHHSTSVARSGCRLRGGRLRAGQSEHGTTRHTGEVVWTKTLQGPVLAAPAVDTHPQLRTGEVLYAIGNSGVMEALSPTDGSTFWAISFRNLIGMPHVNSVSTPVVARESGEGKPLRRVYIGLGYGPAASATPTARLYCFLNTVE